MLLSRSAINTESDSGDEDRSGDSGEERGGVRRFSVPAMAASTCRTRSLDDLEGVGRRMRERGYVSSFILHRCFQYFTEFN